MTAAAGERRRPGRPRHKQPSDAFVARQSEIVEAATEVFRTRGFDATTLEGVAAALDLSRASLYHYVPSKAHLLYLIFDRAISLALDQIDAMAPEPDPVKRLEGFIRLQVIQITENPALFTVFFDDRAALAERYEPEIRAKEQRYLRLLTDVVRDAVAAGALPDVDPRYAAQAILGMTTWVYKWFDPARHDADQVVRTCLGLLVAPQR